MNPQSSLAVDQNTNFDNMPRETLELLALHNCPAEWFYELQDSLESVTDDQLIYISKIKEFIGDVEKVIIKNCWQVGNVLGAKIGIHNDGSGICFYHRLTIINDNILFGMGQKIFSNNKKQIKERSFLKKHVLEIKDLIQTQL